MISSTQNTQTPYQGMDLSSRQEKCGIALFVHADPNRDVRDSALIIAKGVKHRGYNGAGAIGWRSQADTYESVQRELPLGKAFPNGFDETLAANRIMFHCRYTITGENSRMGLQPMAIETKSFGTILVAHNGNLLNDQAMRIVLGERGYDVPGSSDTAALTTLLKYECDHCDSNTPLVDVLAKTLNQVKGSYSLTIMTKDASYAVRDPGGNRPLMLGKGKNCVVIASENPTFEKAGVTFIRDVEPGEIVKINNNATYESSRFSPQGSRVSSECLFEVVYFRRDDSTFRGRPVSSYRHDLGRNLVDHVDKKVLQEVDLIVPVPSGGIYYAQGIADEYALRTGHASKYSDEIIKKNPLAQKTYITPEDQRVLAQGEKYIFDQPIAGKKILLVDDSCVRGNTALFITNELLSRGAAEVHWVFCWPKVEHQCFYGIVMEPEELIMRGKDEAWLAKYLNCTSTTFAKSVHIQQAFGPGCMACVTDFYPLGRNLQSFEFLPLSAAVH